MVATYPKSMEFKVHTLIAKKDISTMKKGEIKNCLIMEYSDKRYAVFSLSHEGYFYTIIPTREELNNTFNEQLQIVEN